MQPVQRKVPRIPYTTLLQVPDTKGGRLLKEICKIEPRLAKTSGYQRKIVEKGGRPLSNIFSRNVSSLKCHRASCMPCNNPTVKGSSLCQVKSIVYEGVCVLCDQAHKADKSKPHKGYYVGQTSRTLYERCVEHGTSYRRKESSSFMFKHWAVWHSDMLEPPEFLFRVVRCHKDPMSRT